ncbi:GHKL domain-containing protein [Lachnospiraceae bacterium MD329]|nr:GHKL domain-containing protein [Lachnospiraceae bacterium MD329]
MVNAFEIGVNIFEELVITLFMVLYFGNKYNDWRKHFGFFLTTIVAVLSITFFNSKSAYEGFLGLIFIAIYFFYALIFLKGNKYIELFIAAFINSIVYFIALFSSLIVNMIFNNGSGQLYEMSIDRIILIVMSKILFILSCILLLKFKFNNVTKKETMILLSIMPIITMLSMVGIMSAFIEHDDLKNELLLAAVSVMLANILTYYLFIKMSKDAEQESKIAALEQRYESEKKYAKSVKELYKKTCAIRHNMIEHFQTIGGLLTDKDSKAMKYLQKITKTNLDEIKALVKTDNDCFDAIANIKLAICNNIGIKPQIRVMKHSLDKVQPDDIGVLFGNLFDNAIEASEKTADKRIELDVQKQGDRCSILMMNSIDESVLENNKELSTTKEDKEKHGFGVKSIKLIVEKYDGIIQYFEENGYFYCDIII